MHSLSDGQMLDRVTFLAIAMSLEDYRQGLSSWVRGERDRLAEDGVPISHRKLSVRIAIEIGADIDGETLRTWEAKPGKRRITPEKEEAIAAYCRATNQEIPKWLADRLSISVGMAPPIEYIRQAHPGQASQIAEIVAEGIKWLVNNGYATTTPKPKPRTIEAFRDELGQNAATIAQLAQLPIERIQAIASGTEPIWAEALAIAAWWDIEDGQWLIDLLKLKTNRRSKSTASADPIAKVAPHQPPTDGGGSRRKPQ